MNLRAGEGTPKKPAGRLADLRRVWASSRSLEKAGIFDPEYYRRSNADLRIFRRWPFAHYALFGRREGRNPSAALDIPFFLECHPEASRLQQDPADFFLAEMHERSSDPNFTRLSPILYNYDFQLRSVGESGLFSGEWYSRHYPDLRALSPREAVNHYCRQGWREKRDPHTLVPHAFLTSSMPTLWAGRINPLVYFIHGLTEEERLRAWSRQCARVAGRLKLHAALINGTTFPFTCTGSVPEISVILVLYNRAEWTASCLESLRAQIDSRDELIIVDNGSTDETAALLELVAGARVIRNSENLGYGAACNIAARAARGRQVLFLNNDVVLLPGAVAAARATLDRESDIGAVGGRLIHPDGLLQEAGGIVWRDGVCQAYGRGQAPLQSAFEFQREVDFCSAAFLLVKTDVLRACDYFDPAYSPAYYEDVDLCIRMKARGWRTIYEPRSLVIHAEYGSSDSAVARGLMAQNWEVFMARHHAALADHLVRTPEMPARAGTANRSAPRILVLDVHLPFPDQGRGFPRALAILKQLLALRINVTLFTLVPGSEPWGLLNRELPPGVEIINDQGLARLQPFLAERREDFDAIICSREGSMLAIQQIRDVHPDWFVRLRLIYDTEAVSAERVYAENLLAGNADAERLRAEELQRELALAREVDVLWVVSLAEAEIFRQHGCSDVRVLAHGEVLQPGPATFASRSGFLFLGMIHPRLSPPNTDAIFWFLEKVFPLIRKRLGPDIPMTVAGRVEDVTLPAVPGQPVRLTGPLGDLAELFNSHRVFVAPTRFSAGIPLKVCTAAARGVPVVASEQLALQLGWRGGEQLLAPPTGDAEAFAEACIRLYTDPVLWQSIRERALEKMASDHSEAQFRQGIRQTLVDHLGEWSRNRE